MKIPKPMLSKDNFIEILCSMDIQKINELIEEKGKKTKGVPLITVDKEKIKEI